MHVLDNSLNVAANFKTWLKCIQITEIYIYYYVNKLQYDPSIASMLKGTIKTAKRSR